MSRRWVDKPVSLDLVDLFQQHLGVDHDAVADHRRDMRIHDPRRDEVQLERAPPVNDGVPGVVPALEPDDVVHVVGEQVGDLALTLVAPLGADKDDSGHVRTPREFGPADSS